MNFGASTFIWASPFSTKTLGLVKKVHDMGFDIIEVCIEDPALIDSGRTKESLTENAIGSTICGAFGPDRDASSEDKSIRENAVKYLEACIDVAQAIGAPLVAGPMYSAVGKTRLLSPSERAEQWNLGIETLKPVADYAGERGVRLAIEPLNRFETDFINTAEQGLDLVDRIGAYAQAAASIVQGDEFGGADARRRCAAGSNGGRTGRVSRFSSVGYFPRSLALVALPDCCGLHYWVYGVRVADSS